MSEDDTKGKAEEDKQKTDVEKKKNDKRPRLGDLLETDEGNSNVMTGESDELLGFSTVTREAQEKHAESLRTLEIKHRQRTIVVQTRDDEVQIMLRKLSQPITLFGERAFDRRERLKRVIAEQEVDEGLLFPQTFPSTSIQKPRSEEKSRLFYTEASDGLIVARHKIAEFSWQQAKARLLKEWTQPPQVVAVVKGLSLKAAQTELRPISSCAISSTGFAATGSFDGNCRIYRASNDYALLWTLHGHQERICDVSFSPSQGACRLASGSADGEVRIWEQDRNTAILKGHVNRTAKVRWDLTGDRLATTSYDRTWRLWDAETSTCLLIQEGHSKEVYGCAFHPDGSLLCTTDLGAACRVWDLRSGITSHTFSGHILGILSADFSSNGFHLATGGLDNQVRVWDLRKKACLQVIPGHTRIVTACRFSKTGCELYSLSHDRSLLAFDVVDWKKRASLACHEHIATDLDVGFGNTLVTCGHDKILKFIEHL